jgi:putative ABC transport system substrate-binding protein
MNNRRKLVIALGAGALSSPFTLYAQPQTKVWRVGYLGTTTPDAFAPEVAALRAGLREQGYEEGRNLVFDARWADGNYERLPALAAELVAARVDVIVANGTPGTRAARQATAAIPIVMIFAADPVGAGLVISLARPGGNITGQSNLIGDISPKYLELLRSMVPKLTRVALLVNPNNAGMTAVLKNVQAAAPTLGMSVVPCFAGTAPEIDKAFLLMVKEKAGAVIVGGDGFFLQQRRQIAALTAAHRLPALGAYATLAEAGVLMSYGVDSVDNFRRLATHASKILKGAKAADLPVEQPTKIELVINGKTAKALGLKIPQSLLVMADKVIE